MATLATDPTVKAVVDALAPLYNSGEIQFYDAAHVLLCHCHFSATAFGSANDDGVAQAYAIAVSDAAVAGTIDYALIVKSNGLTPVAELTCDDEAGTDLVFDSLVLGTGDTVFIRALSLLGPD